MNAADGTILIDTKIDTDGMKDAGKDIATSFESVFKGNVLADIAEQAFSRVGEAIHDLAVEAIDAAADIRAENAQFAETFKDLEKTATKSLEEIADETGITASRMKQSYTKTFAFTKSVGADSEKAMDIANRAMRAAADSAAYYDTSIEQATETLQSFLKGNYENDAALGIAATETTRNAKANELYAMSFDKLSEAQKVDVLLAMVEAGNQASGALGQAARESDAWTNVLGEAQEAWRQFLGVIGDPILDAITPIVQSITEAVEDLTKVSASKELKDGISDFLDSWEDAEKVFQETAEDLETDAIMAKHYVKRLEELESAGLDTADAQREYADTVRLLSEIYPDLNLEINENTGLLKNNKAEIYETIDAMKQQALYQAALQRYTDSLDAQAAAIIKVNEALYERSILQGQEEVALELFAQKTGMAAEEVAWLADLYLKAGSAAMDYADFTLQLSRDETALMLQVTENRLEQEKLNEEIAKGEETIAEYDAELKRLADSLGDYTDTSDKAADSQDEVRTTAEETAESVKVLGTAYEEAKDAARDSIDSQIGLFDELTEKSEYSALKIIENWRAQQEAFENYTDNMLKAVDMGLDDALVKQLSDGSEKSMQILHALVNDTDVSIDDINEAFSGVSESRDTVSAVMADISTDLSNTLEKMAKDIESQWGDMADTVGMEVAQMQEYIDGLQGKTVKLEIKKSSSGGGVAFSESTPNSALNPFSTFSVPYLASGAVIPPNAPFMAVLGDQRRGTNIEAPLETIQTAVASVLADFQAGNMAGHEAVVQRLERLIATVENIEVGDTVIGEAAKRYSQKSAIMTGGW